MERFPEEVLLNIFQYISPRQIGKLLRVNRWFNYVLSRNFRRLKKINVHFIVAKLHLNEILFIMAPREHANAPQKTINQIRLLIGTDRIAIQTIPGYRWWKKIAEYLAWKTGSEVKKGVKIDQFKMPAFVVPVENPQEAFLLILKILATRIEIVYSDVVNSLALPVEFRWNIWNCLESFGTRMCHLQAYGDFPIEEILYLNAHLGTPSFRFNIELRQFSTDPRLLQVSGENVGHSTFIDDLLQYVDRLSFAAYSPYKLVSPDSLSSPIREWQMGSFDDLAVEFYASHGLGVLQWISKHFDVNLVPKGPTCRSIWPIFLIMNRRKDGKSLWIRELSVGEIRKYTFTTKEEDIREYRKRINEL